MKRERFWAWGTVMLLLLCAWMPGGLTQAAGQTETQSGAPEPTLTAPTAAPSTALTAAPIILQKEDEGYWLYQSESLCVTITRHVDETIPLIWYEADLRCSPEAPLRCVLSDQERPGRNLKKPDVIARENGFIYAQTDDFFGDRVSSRKLKTGVIIRGGTLLYDRVYHGQGKPFPPLDALAVFPNGSFETFLAGAYTGEQFLAMGATDVVSFGPVLIADGVIDTRLPDGYDDHEPRSAIGMITPYHYIGMVVEGRHEGSAGCGLQRIAQRMLELGVKEALNLDGGQTAAMLFMGQQINQTGRYKHKASVRSVSGVFGIKEITPASP